MVADGAKPFVVDHEAMSLATRRNFLSLFGAAAAGGAASVLASGDGALAATGTMSYGGANDAGTDSTALLSSSTNGTFRAVNTATDQWAFVGEGDYLYGGYGDRKFIYGTAGEVGIDIGAADKGVWAKGGNVAVQGEGEPSNHLSVGAVFAGQRAAAVLEVDQVDSTKPSCHAYLSGVIDPFVGPNRLVGELVSDGTDLWYCIANGNPGTWRTLSGAGASGAFHAITPVRVYDSRLALPLQGTMTQGDTRTISVAASRDLSTGAVIDANVVPARTSAITFNITVTNTVGSGWMAVNPGGNTTVSASSINWSETGQSLANGTIVPVNADREITLICGKGTTHVIIDVTGYYR
ncbi:MAG TPA: hypothetical protein DCR14_05660 [Acidimicrobiaceae bacterium]|nr:hypothetical protein [Acidimicrobiaceae bacterium]